MMEKEQSMKSCVSVRKREEKIIIQNVRRKVNVNYEFDQLSENSRERMI
jgi:hypothetical protein